ncbi:hypothetical protein BRC62_02495, partial [Halobacteriales archaeon QH_10_67_13]
MLRPERMSRVSVTGSKRVMDDAIEAVYDLNVVHVTDYDGGWEGFDPGDPTQGADERVRQVDVGVAEHRDGLAVAAPGEGFEPLEPRRLFEFAPDGCLVALADRDREVVVARQQVEVDTELDERLDGPDALLDRPELVVEFVAPVVQRVDPLADLLEFGFELLVGDDAGRAVVGLVRLDPEDRLQRPDGDEPLGGLVGALGRVAGVEPLPAAVVVGYVD